MFGRNHEILHYNVYPTNEGREILAEQALGRMVTEEGVDYLDGFKLPPDNDELWEPGKIYHVRGTILDENPRVIDYEHPASLTNQDVRKINMSSIVVGGEPLIRKWQDIDMSDLIREPRQRLLTRVKDKVGSLFFEKTAAS